MNISEINPFIRFAKCFMHIPQNNFCLAKDCRIFYVYNAGENDLIYIKSEVYPIKSNSLIFISANTPYKFVIKKPIKIISVNFDFTQYRKDVNEPFEKKYINRLCEYKLSASAEFFEEYLPLNKYIFLEDGANFLDLLNKVIKSYNTPKSFSLELASAALKLLLLDIIIANEKISAYTSYSYNKDKIPIQQVKIFIKEHYKENLSNDIIARQVDYHSHYLNRIFKKTEGVSIHRYLINYRIIMAEKLLLETENSVTFIAEQVGFENATSFTQNFKAKNNLPPLKYRNFYRRMI